MASYSNNDVITSVGRLYNIQLESLASKLGAVCKATKLFDKWLAEHCAYDGELATRLSDADDVRELHLYAMRLKEHANELTRRADRIVDECLESLSDSA
jgi:hypothetical protein